MSNQDWKCKKDAYYYYDRDILTKRLCPLCKSRIVSHPDCTESCSNKKCKYIGR